MFDRIMAYDDGALGEEETISLFQELIDTGLAWTLEDEYRDKAQSLLDEGYCSY